MRNLIFLFSLIVFFSSCSDDDSLCLKGDGDLVSMDISLDDIHSINMDIAVDIILTQKDEQKISISAQQNIIDELVKDSDVSQGTWRLRINRNCQLFDDDIRIFMDIKSLESLSIDGSGSIRTEGVFAGVQDLDLDIEGSGEIDLDLEDVDKVVSRIDGSGKITLGEGSANEHNITIKGSGDIKAFGFESKVCDIDLDGSGSVEVKVLETLTASVEGSGDICYKGNPDVNSSVDGSGSIDNCD